MLIIKKRQEMIKGALIGNPVDKSVSHITHNAIFEKLNIKASYQKKLISIENFEKEIHELKSEDFAFFAVTMPFKERIISFLDENILNLSSVNTILVKDGKWIGYNFDGIGCLNSIERKIKVKGKKILIIGAGGAAISAIDEALKRGAIVFVWNRNFDKALKLKQFFSVHVLQKLYGDFDVIVNCTPVGMFSNETIVAKALLHRDLIAMDMIYSPQHTQFLKDAVSFGAKIVLGYEMFEELTFLQLHLVFGDQIDKEIVFSEIRKIFIKN
jgi:shikimate dehydrogenase